MASLVWLTGSFFFSLSFFCILYSNCLINFNLCTKCMLLSGECSFKQLSVFLLLVCDVSGTSVDIFLPSRKVGRPSATHFFCFIMHRSVWLWRLFTTFHVAARLQGAVVGYCSITCFVTMLNLDSNVRLQKVQGDLICGTANYTSSA